MLVYLAVVVLICAYVYVVLKPKQDFQIIQTSLHNITDDMLYEKYPICINDRVINVSDLLQSLFKYQYMFKSQYGVTQPFHKTNHAKFLVIHNDHEGQCELEISSPNKNTTGVQMILPAYNVLILPYMWSVSITTTTTHSDNDNNDTCNLRCISLNDFTHFLFNIHLD
jgi:hypothetical protein